MDSYYWSFDFYFFLLVCTEFYSDTGLCFWWILIKRISNPRFAERYTGKIYRVLKILDLILLGVGTLIIIFNSSDFSTFIISVAIWFFAVIEWMNYFKWQLSYSLNPAVLLKYIFQRKFGV